MTFPDQLTPDGIDALYAGSVQPELTNEDVIRFGRFVEETESYIVRGFTTRDAMDSDARSSAPHLRAGVVPQPGETFRGPYVFIDDDGGLGLRPEGIAIWSLGRQLD